MLSLQPTPVTKDTLGSPFWSMIERVRNRTPVHNCLCVVASQCPLKFTVSLLKVSVPID